MEMIVQAQQALSLLLYGLERQHHSLILQEMPKYTVVQGR